MEVIPFPDLAKAPSGPQTPSRWERICRALALALGVAFIVTLLFAVSLALAVMFYDGPNLRFGVGGLSLFAGDSPGSVTMDAFSVSQRLVGVALVLLLCAPAVFILHQARLLAAAFSKGRMFSDDCAQGLRRIAWGFVAYAFAPPLAHGVAILVGMTGDPIWLRFEFFGALLLAALLALLAQANARAGAIEQDRDGFV
ncbi:MAG: DUF2975 domain-containing protein [Candidatus Gastranaerophilales bacterium]|nr:DUF2975 domain-containing protein [Candidatus Gastranaerophilales bacterium]